MSFKRDFLDYVLFQYEFKNKDSVYVLNFLKTHAHFDTRVSFVRNDSPIRLTISSIDTATRGIMCRIEDRIYINAQDIFTAIDETEDKIFIEFHFNHFEPKYTEVVFKEKERLEYVQETKRVLLYNKIEEALLQKDKDTFLTLTKELKLLDEESKNALHKK